MNASLLRSIATWISCAVITLNAAEEPKTAEVLRAVSPNKKFAMRIVCESEHANDEEIPAHAVRSVSLVSLPDKKEAAPLIKEDDFVGFGGLKLVWSDNSEWFAFYSSTQRIGYTTVFRRNGERFAQVGKQEHLAAPHGVDIRNEYISPIRWLKPGVLLLQHRIIPQGEGDGLNVQFTATYNAKAGDFRIGGVKTLTR